MNLKRTVTRAMIVGTIGLHGFDDMVTAIVMLLVAIASYALGWTDSGGTSDRNTNR